MDHFCPTTFCLPLHLARPQELFQLDSHSRGPQVVETLWKRTCSYFHLLLILRDDIHSAILASHPEIMRLQFLGLVRSPSQSFLDFACPLMYAYCYFCIPTYFYKLKTDSFRGEDDSQSAQSASFPPLPFSSVFFSLETRYLLLEASIAHSSAFFSSFYSLERGSGRGVWNFAPLAILSECPPAHTHRW